MRTGLDGVVPSVRLVATVLQGCEGRSRSLQPVRRVLQKYEVSDVAYDAVLGERRGCDAVCDGYGRQLTVYCGRRVLCAVVR